MRLKWMRSPAFETTTIAMRQLFFFASASAAAIAFFAWSRVTPGEPYGGGAGGLFRRDSGGQNKGAANPRPPQKPVFLESPSPIFDLPTTRLLGPRHHQRRPQ